MPDSIQTLLETLADRIESLERRVEAVVVSRLEKEWYTTDEVAVLADRAPWTVRDWARRGLIKAVKRAGSDKWMVSREELERLMNEGLRKPAK